MISGTTAAGQTLSGSAGAWSGTPPISLSYHWERCAGSCSPIAGATSSSYRLTHADVGTEVALAVTATNSAGSAAATSAQVGPVTTAGPTPRQVKHALLDALKRSDTASIGQLLKDRADTVVFSAPSPGQLAIGWYLTPKATQPLLIASANVIIRSRRALTVRITLTGSGRLLLEHSSHLKLAATATFSPVGGIAANAISAVTLRK